MTLKISNDLKLTFRIKTSRPSSLYCIGIVFVIDVLKATWFISFDCDFDLDLQMTLNFKIDPSIEFITLGYV